MKKLLKVLKVILLVACAVGIVLGSNSLLVNHYWKQDGGNFDTHMDRYQNSIDEITASDAELNRYFDENYEKHLSEPTEKQQKDIDKHKTYVIDYFMDEYGIDVSEQMNTLDVYILDFQFLNDYTGGNITGVYIEEEHLLGIGACFYTEEGIENGYYDMRSDTIIHEMIHAAGICEDKDAEFFTEGFTEALTGRVLEHAGRFYADITTYESSVQLAKQWLAFDSRIVEEYLSDMDFDVIGYINEMAGAEIGADLETACMLAVNREKKDTMEFYMQYYMGEIMKQKTEDARSIAEENPLSVILFGLRSLFA